MLKRMNPEQKLCPFCHSPTTETYYFCPNCGKKLKEPPVSTTILKQIGIYALSIFLPPLGLWPGIKYLKQDNKKAKIIGLVAVILTVISTVITVWLTIGLTSQLNSQINQLLKGQVDIYQFQNLKL